MLSFQLDGCMFVQEFQGMFLISCRKTEVITNGSIMFTYREIERHSERFAEEPANGKWKNKTQKQTGIRTDMGVGWGAWKSICVLHRTNK